jgi:hypothetical protein
MESVQATANATNDVLHSDHHSSLTPAEIAKAIAHHKHRHGSDPAQAAKPQPAGKKNK